MKAELIAPCGMNCGICYGYLRAERQCPGCRFRDKKCAIRRCDTFRQQAFEFCFECEKFPCVKIKRLDKRYRTRYNMSMIENLKVIQQQGLPRFLDWQTERYKCPNCGGVLCIHNGRCYGTCDL